MLDFETVMMSTDYPIRKMRVWHDSESGWWLQTPRGHLGKPDAEQLRGTISLACPEPDCNEHFTLLPVGGTLERILQVGEL